MPGLEPTIFHQIAIRASLANIRSGNGGGHEDRHRDAYRDPAPHAGTHEPAVSESDPNADADAELRDARHECGDVAP